MTFSRARVSAIGNDRSVAGKLANVGVIGSAFLDECRLMLLSAFISW